MSKNRQFLQQIQKIYRNISQYPDNIKERRNWLLKTFLVANKRGEWVNSGFVLPTISFVSLVLVLLTTAILFRSLERSKNAGNVRVNEAVLNAATPAIDRAKAKLNKLFSDARLPRATPTDTALASHFVTNNKDYTFGDEKQLKVQLTSAQQNDLTTTEKAKLTDPDISQQEKDALIQKRSVWMYPVDTDNNGKYDTYTIYGIYFKNPPVSGGKFTRSRNALEARSIPMLGGNIGGSCGNIIGTSATLVGDSGWFKIGSKLKKSFYVYTTNVPITTPPNNNDYEAYKGNQGFSALEYQQERVQLPLVNNAVVYEDDLEITPGPTFNLNGRIITNSNLLSGSAINVPSLYQISSKESCFYEAENAKIIVGGNLGAGSFLSTGNLTKGTEVHLFRGVGNNPWKSNTITVKKNTSVTNEPRNIAYNSLAYTQRINHLVDAQMAKADTTDPQEVKNGISTTSTRREQLELYFKKRTRRVPYEEVAFNGDAIGIHSAPLNGSGDTLRPPDEWIYPFNPNNGNSIGTGYSDLTLNKNGTSDKLLPNATKPERLEQELQGVEQYVGDRITLGNNLPQLWWDGSKFVGAEETRSITNHYWNDPSSTDADNTRTRNSQIQDLADLGSITRDGTWEEAAAEKPDNELDPTGGLRVITGAGIYLPDGFTTASGSFPTPGNVWSDMQPVPQAPKPASTSIKPYWMYAYTDGEDYAGITYNYDTIADPTITPYLRMRATAVYHHAASGYDQDDPKPIACVSSFYVPTNSDTAMNQTTYNSETLPWNNNANGISNNGIVYGPPTKSVSDYQAALTYISQLTYNYGGAIDRLIDDGLLASALGKSATDRTLAEKSAIDAQICALQILDGSISVATTPPIPHGAIRETAFLDPRQVRTVHTSTSTTDYDLPIKDRQPLEIRVTVLDINQLRATTIGGSTPAQEYLIPNSGVIYASRDDALVDLSGGNTDAGRLTSPVDYMLDPNRRPNGIMLVNGDKLWRVKDYRDAEKGFILASNLPVYIHGDFNLHTKEEFDKTNTSNSSALKDDWSNFYDRKAKNLDPNFACRKDDPRLPNCTVGDEWRSAAVLSDATVLLSNNYRLGYRDEGDYDWTPDPATITVGLSTYFSTTNSYVPVAKWRDTTTNLPKDLVPDVAGDSTTTGFQGSSYLNNFITPIALQIPAGTYFTEMCTATNVSDCSNADQWKMTNQCGNGNGQTYTVTSQNVIGDKVNTGSNKIKTGTILDDPATFTSCIGTKDANGISTSPRRLLYVREATAPYNLVTPLKVLGLDENDRIQKFTLGSTISDAGTKLKSPPSDAFMPWLKPIVSGGNVTRLEPVLQINQPFATPTNSNELKSVSSAEHGNWLQTATETTFNLIIASKDTPARPTEDNGGLHNFPRFIENWTPGSNIKARISGSFMQIGRSLYASGPFSVTNDTNDNRIDTTKTINPYLYANDNDKGRLPYYRPPTRQWGYDVALLSQSPDLFAQKLVTIPDDEPDEYFREVGRDDTWIENLLCAKKIDNTFAINDASQRPSSCQTP